MREPIVADVMTRRVITAVPDTPFKELAGTMLARDIDTIPVIDIAGKPLGMVTDIDILAKLEFHGGDDPSPLLAGAQCRTRWRKSTGLYASDLMTCPAIIITPNTSVSAAIRLLARAQVRRICVVNNSGHLVGLLAHRDALQLFARSDSAIAADIAAATRNVQVCVTDGVVTLDGVLVLHSAALNAGHIAHHVPGVIAVHNRLRYEVDDLMITGL